MDYPKIPGLILRQRREALKLTIRQTAQNLRLSRATWERWEASETPTAPAFVEILLRHLENPDTRVSATGGAKGRKLSVERGAATWQERFFSHTKPCENGCLLWAAGGKFELHNRTATPRKVAWIIKEGGKGLEDAPDFDILTTCGRADCVAAEHLAESKKRTGKRTPISPAVKAAAMLELRQGRLTGKQIQAKYGVSCGTVSAWKKQVNK